MAEVKTAATGPELTARSVVVGLIVAMIIGSAYPYCVSKLGFGPSLSVVSAFFGFMALVPLVFALRLTDTNARENNIVQTMGTSAGQTAFMAVLLAAFDMLNAKGVLNPPIYLNTLQIFCWLCSASLLGILLAVPMRRHYIDEENLTYADGLAAGETIKVLHEGRERGGSSGPLQALGLGTFASAALLAVTADFKWNLIVKPFRGLRGSQVDRNDFPMQWVVIGSLVMSVVICLVQYFSMGIPVYLSFIAILLSLPLMLVGLRVLGETNWGPISAMSNMMQAIFAFISPGNVPVNMSSSGLTGTIAVTSEALMH